MNHEHAHEQSHATSTATTRAAMTHDELLEPGRSSRSALLRKPDHAVASGLLQRKARASSTVADRADQAIADATVSTGSPLPEALMRTFGRSLGADLSGVRIHTGSASAHATNAVGARAYTMGNDIHFGAGHYDTSSSVGQHLLAHEVAHTVQQAGGTKRMQRKLKVSSPGDDLEHEADRAADAMIAGAPAVVSSASGLSRHALQRAATIEPVSCALTTYTGANFIGKTVTADIEFVELLKVIDGYAAEAGVKLSITHSFRKAKQAIRGAIVPPAKRSNHLVGHAIDMNISLGGRLYTSRKLKKSKLKKQPKKVQAFVKRVREDARLRWGGDFSKQDPVHIDDGLNVRNKAAWDARYRATQRAYRNRCG
jgi:hypothetical protein